MKFCIFGLSISSSWGNGHATLWRSLIKSLIKRNHSVIFFEKNTDYYEMHRDFTGFDGLELIIYSSFNQIQEQFIQYIKSSDILIVTSYFQDAIELEPFLKINRNGLKIFYDLDAPVTLSNLKNGKTPFYVGENGYSYYDLVLSYTGGKSLNELKSILKAKKVNVLYGSVDPDVHKPLESSVNFNYDLSYMGTYSIDRHAKLYYYFIKVAKNLNDKVFLLSGALYPSNLKLSENIKFIEHISPPNHAKFYSESKYILNLTRYDMACEGYCPSARLFEAAACGTVTVSDYWQGIEYFFQPNKEILLIRQSQDIIKYLQMPIDERTEIASNARKRVLLDHTSDIRADELIEIIKDELCGV